MKKFPSKSILIIMFASVATEAVILGLDILSGPEVDPSTTDKMGLFSLIAAYLHFPGFVIAEMLNLRGDGVIAAIAITGALQYFLLFWLIAKAFNRKLGISN